ncbi:hypothetical protein ACFOEZ_20290 [Tianweitania populi]|uniref:hypothetical protein n=1 Tax=Tianweitania populi TaxID=1607949 RepID=UPI0027E57E6A|nr:hypothetical protein [Tianweitania populi]
MVKAGQAALLLQYLPSSHPIDLHDYHAAEESARARRRGLWGAQMERPSSYRRVPTPQLASA